MAKENSVNLMTRLKVAEQFKAMSGKRSNNGDLCNKAGKQIKKSVREAKPKPDRKHSEAKSLVADKAKESSTQSTQQQQPMSPPKELIADSTTPIKMEVNAESFYRPTEYTTIVLSSSEDEDDGENENKNDKVQAVRSKPQEKAEPVANADGDDAASNHSNSSSCSSASTKRRYQQKLNTDAENVVDSFEKLILPQLKDSLAERYRSNHCNNLQSRLHFISCVVTSGEHNSQKFSKIQVAKVQQNLKTADYRLGVEFLLREIVNVVNLQKQTALARRKQQAEKKQPAPNELIITSPLGVNECKNAELASEAHQRDCIDDKEAAALPAPIPASMPPTPPRNGTPTYTATMGRSLHPMPLCSLPRLSPGSFSMSCGMETNEPMMLLGDSVVQGLLDIDRRLLENQSRRGFLEEMIMKFQKEKTDLEMLSLELQSRKFLLLNSVISRNQLSSVTPTSSPPPVMQSASLIVSSAESFALPVPQNLPVDKPKLRKRRAVVVKRIKILAKRKPSVRCPRQTKSAKCNDETTQLSDEIKAKSNEQPKEPAVPQPIIKEEPKETIEIAAQPSTENAATVKHATSSSMAVESPKRQRLARSRSTSAVQQPLAVIPPLPPPPPPPEPFANMSYELPRMLLKPPPPLPSVETPPKSNAESFNYGYIPSGRLHNITSPITQIRIYKVFIIAASENGDVYVYNIGSHKLERQITKHSEAITNMFLCEKESFLYTTSLDGFLKKSSLENLERVVQTVYLKEPLQSIDIDWGVAFIGSRWGNIFTYNIASNKVMDMPLLSTGQSIIAVKATKEGVRKIILLGCKGNLVFLHDAATGLLLRRLSVPDGLNVYSLLLADGHVYCGTQKNEVFKFEFASGSMVSTLSCGNGAVAMATYEDKYLLIGCYDGFIYVLNKENGRQLGRFSGPGRLVLALAIAGDKVVTSSKDNSLEILEIPQEILNLQQSALN